MARQKLVELMQSINFGRIEHLSIRAGEPVLKGDAATRIFRELKFGGDNGPRADHADDADFALKAQVVELFRQFDGTLALLVTFTDARVEVLVIKHGLPFTMHVESPCTAA